MADKLLGKVLRLHIEDASEMVAPVSVLDCGLSSQKHALYRRWKQINVLLQTALMQTKS